MKLSDVTVKTKLTLVASLFVVGMTIFGIVAYTTLTTVKIGGTAYQEIMITDDVQTDSAPPPGYLLAARVEIFKMLVDAKNESRLRTEVDLFEQASKAFENTNQTWLKRLPEGRIRTLIQAVYDTGHAYAEAAHTQYIPLLLKGKIDEASILRDNVLRPQFDSHLAADQALMTATAEIQATAEKNTDAMVSSRTFMLVLVALIVMGMVSAITWFVAGGIIKPLRATVEMLREVSQGNLTRRLEVAGADEIGQMGSALNDTVDNLSRAMEQIGADVQTLSQASEEAGNVSRQLGSACQRTNTQAAAVSAAAEQVRNVQTVSTATEEMSASIKEISKNASEAAEVASSAARLAGATTATMTKLSESSAEIGNVIKVITSIAEQTNLLALNATIEAARAGEAGKGFAVVANEVKELAKETAKATEDIGTKVEAIQNDAKGAVQAIDEITTVIGRINDIQNTIASAVEEQTGTTNEISRNISETAKGSSDIASNISGVAQAANDTQASAASAEHSAEELSKVAASLSSVISQFTLASSSNGHLRNGAATVGTRVAPELHHNGRKIQEAFQA